MGTGDLYRVPPAGYTTGKPVKVQGRDRVGIVEDFYGLWARGVSIWGKFVLSTNPGYTTRDSHVAKSSSYPRVAYPEIKV